MQKKKIGILTFHTALNYGAILQAYALKNQLDEWGYETHIINYCPDYLDESVAPFKKFCISANKKQALVGYIRSMMSYPGDKGREQEFLDFRRVYLSESVLCKNAEDVEKLEYDVYISGSDQIWNYQITGNKFDPVFFLNLKNQATKIIYAASSQDIPFPLNYENGLKKELTNTTASISIREKKLADYASSLTGIDYPVVLDPVLLAGNEFIKKIRVHKSFAREYILIYQIDSNPFSDITVKNLEKKFNCSVYTMTVPRIGSIHGRIGNVGPEKFLTYLNNAKFLVTNSFHGIALSLLLHKQFYVYENGGVMTRIDNLLDHVHLMTRKVKMASDINLADVIDFDEVDEILKVSRQESIDFLRSALNNEFQTKKYSKSESKLLAMRDREKEDCCGCGSCASACPMTAIHMEKDEEGFLYPHINVEKCIDCGVCDKACGFVKRQISTEYYAVPEAYGVKHRDNNIRGNSRSGAAFIAFSDYILSLNGVIYGAAFDNDFSVLHIRAINSVTRNKMQKAKYVQSNTVGIFPQIMNDLLEDRYVLFSGTSCQVSGLRAYLKAKKIDDSKLVCCDLVCHGVPSPDIWKEYLRYVEMKNGGKIISAEFRDKEFGWDSHFESFVMNNKTEKYVSRDYTDLFHEHLIFRPSCYNCQFSNISRVGDITLADFWGIEKNNADFDDNKGVSLVLLNTDKGKKMFDIVKTDFEWFECSVENCMQPTLYHPSNPSGRMELFWKDYKNMDFADLLKKYTTPLSLSGRVKKSTKYILYRMGVRKHP